VSGNELKKLERGDIVRHNVSGESYIVLEPRRTVAGRVVVAIREIEISNPVEWTLARSSKETRR
jgi:hypothetical protein